MYHIMTIVPLLQIILPLVPWTHNKHEDDIVVTTISNMEKTNPLQPTPFIVMLLKTFMFAQGIGQALVDPIKGGPRENIFKWMRVMFSAHLWCVVKCMLQEEGYFLFVGSMIVSISRMEATSGSGI